MAESKSYPLIVEYRRSTSALQGSTMPRELFVFSIGSPQRERVWEVCRTHSQITPSYNKDDGGCVFCCCCCFYFGSSVLPLIIGVNNNLIFFFFLHHDCYIIIFCFSSDKR